MQHGYMNLLKKIQYNLTDSMYKHKFQMEKKPCKNAN